MFPIRFVPANTSIPFISMRRVSFLVSALMTVGSIVVFLMMGLNFGVDFRGGILIEVRTQGPADVGAMRNNLSSLNIGEVNLQLFGEPNEVLINIQRQEGDEKQQIKAIETVKGALGPGIEYRRTEFVGPKVGEELKEAGTWAVMLSLGAILVYIWFRFEWQFGIAAIVATMHDVFSTIGLFALLQLEFNLSTLAAILTIAGYSINDTVVVFDRIRETLRRYKREPLANVLNRAINDTLSRTTMTSFTTLLAVLALYIFGGEVIRGFSLAMIWGIMVGTYSSIFVASPLLLYLNVRRQGRGEAGEKPETEEAPAEAG